MSSRSAVITGAGGFIGSHLAERCLALGWRVTAIDGLTTYYDPALKRRNLQAVSADRNCTVVEADLLDVDLRSLLRDASIVFHLAAQPGVRTSWDQFDLYTRQNVIATQRLLHAAPDLQLERVVIASSSSVYGNAEKMPTSEATALEPVSPYGVTKAATEHLAALYWRSFGVPTVCLRYFTVYGPRQRPDMAFNRLITTALAGHPFEVFGDGNQTRDFTFVADAVSGTVAAGESGRPGGVYNIGGGSRRSMNDVFDTLSELLDRRVECRHTDRQVGDARDTAADISLASRDLGFAPSFSFEAGLTAQLEWQRATVETSQAFTA